MVERPLPLVAPHTAKLGRRAQADTTTRLRVYALRRALRPRQWSKNLLVLAAPAAAGILARPAVLTRVGLAFVVLCLVASATYLVNDVVDAPADRRHPLKRDRPIAAGDLSPAMALATSVLLFASGIGLGSILGGRFLLVVATYVALTTAYTLRLKRIEVFDLATVAACYVLRALAGAAATSVPISPWFLIVASAVAVFVVAGKRSADRSALVLEIDARGPGPDYSAAYLRYVWVLASGVALASYCLWAFAVPHLVDGLAWSEISIVPFALAILRYALLVERGGGGQPEEVLLRDRSLQLIGAVWLVVYAIGVYAK